MYILYPLNNIHMGFSYGLCNNCYLQWSKTFLQDAIYHLVYVVAKPMMVQPSWVAARFLYENLSPIPVHCFTHSLNLCLQGVGKNVLCIRDALEMVKEVGKLIQFFPKWHHLFNSSTSFQHWSEPTVIVTNKMDSLRSSNWYYHQIL